MNNNRTSQKSPLRYMNTNQRRTYQTQKQQRYPLQTDNDRQIEKLANHVLEVFQKNYIQYSPNYQEIYSLIEQDPPATLNQNSVLRIIRTVRQFYEAKLDKEMPLKRDVTPQFNQNDEIKPSNVTIHPVLEMKDNNNLVPSNRVLDGNTNPIALPPPINGGFHPPTKPVELMDTTTECWEHIIVIDSKDRDLNRFNEPNNFVIDFSPASYTSDNERKGYIKRGFHNVISVEVLSCCFLDTSSELDSSDTTNPPPYVILEIPELSNNIHGTNDELSKGFDILTTYSTQGNYKYYNLPTNWGPTSFVKQYEPRISINKLTIRYKLPDGSYYNFGDTNNSNILTVNKLVLKIKQMKHRISTTFLHKENS